MKRKEPDRLNFAIEQLRTKQLADARQEIMNRYNIGEQSANKEIRAAREVIAKSLNAVEVRIDEVTRLRRIADRTEKAADRALTGEDCLGGAALHKTAIAASKEIARLCGANAPEKVEITHTGSVEVSLQIDAVLNVLDDRDNADLARITEKILRAKQAGLLPIAAESTEVPDDDEPTHTLKDTN